MIEHIIPGDHGANRREAIEACAGGELASGGRGDGS
jgi:hypothetical protein